MEVAGQLEAFPLDRATPALLAGLRSSNNTLQKGPNEPTAQIQIHKTCEIWALSNVAL